MTAVTQSLLRDLLDYDPETGLFTRLTSTGGVGAGSVAGGIRKNGYVYISIRNKEYGAHRLAWLYMTGQWPKNQLDHINRVATDNRFSNLRECTCAENQQNAKLSRANKSGYTGVSFHPQTGKWQAAIRCRGKLKYLGLFNSKEDAYNAYSSKKRAIHVFQPYTGRWYWKEFEYEDNA